MPTLEAPSIGSAESLGTQELQNGQNPTSVSEAVTTAVLLPEAPTVLSDGLMLVVETQISTAPSGRRQTVKGSDVKWEEP